MKGIVSIFPSAMATSLESLPKEKWTNVQEIRLRISRPIEINFGREVFFLPYIVKEDELQFILNRLSDYSMYAIEEELKQGFITMQGGHRVGLAGKVVTENGHVKMIRDVSSLNFRVSKERIGTVESLLPYLYDEQEKWLNTIIVGPPQSGKTTLLRDIARMMSEGSREKRIQSVKVGIVDERSEIAGCIKGVPQHRLGVRVDVLDHCPKAEGMMMLIRSMSPDVIVVDEIGRHEDSEAVMEAVHAGVRLMLSAHGRTIEEIQKRSHLASLLNQEVFQRIVLLESHNHHFHVYDAQLRLLKKEGVLV